MLDDKAQERRRTSDLMRKVESAAVRKLLERYHTFARLDASAFERAMAKHAPLRQQ